VLKKTAPSTPGMSGLPLTTFIIFFVSAGADAKAELEKLVAAWDDLKFL
jgi:hypothetical protein